MRRLGVLVSVAIAVLVPTTAAGRSAAPAVTRCPSEGTPAPWSTIRGGVEVDGFQCKLTNVTVYGGITVDATGTGDLPVGYLILNGSTVNGGIVVNGGMDVGDDDFFNFTRTYNPSTINGGVTFNDALTFAFADATIDGGVMVNGIRDPAPIFGCTSGDPFCFIGSVMCTNTQVYGNVTIKDVAVGQAFIGDPGEQFYANSDCGGPTIHGSLLLKDSNWIRFDGEANEIEGATVAGSVRVDHSTAEVYGNTIGGSLLCTNGSVMLPAPPGDPSGTTNTVQGANTCF